MPRTCNRPCKHLKANQYLNLSAFCRAAIAEKLKRHLKESPTYHNQNQQQQETIPMKTITMRIPAVEAAMLVELQKTNKHFRNLEALVLGLIREEYGKKK